MRPAFAAAACTAVLLTGCGSASPKIGSAAYLTQCRREIANRDRLDQRFAMTPSQVTDYCACIQHEFVRHGFGDKRTDDDVLDDAGPPLARACEVKVLGRR
jgi:hypothetical protein